MLQAWEEKSQTAANSVGRVKGWPGNIPARWNLLRSWLPESACVPRIREFMKTTLLSATVASSRRTAMKLARTRAGIPVTTRSGLKRRLATAPNFFYFLKVVRILVAFKNFSPNNHSYSREEKLRPSFRRGSKSGFTWRMVLQRLNLETEANALPNNFKEVSTPSKRVLSDSSWF